MSELTNQASKSEGISLENKMYRLPEQKTMENAFKLSLTEDKPIMMDYWASSVDNTSIIGVQEDDKKMLIKSDQEYTSYIDKVYQITNHDKTIIDYIIKTENSIYLVSGSINTKRVTMN
tara:strand:+ start:51 stop:407 length:357 start_codon:yes stop_codon:yes gene_type:complete